MSSRSTPRAPGPDAPSGMPLPTGYGIQVAGPGNEDIVIPICLPPGFELASLVIVPSFLPDGERAPAEPARHMAVAPLADDDPDAPARAAGPAPAERLDGGVRLVYGESQPYSAQLDQSPLPAPGEREEPALREARRSRLRALTQRRPARLGVDNAAPSRTIAA